MFGQEGIRDIMACIQRIAYRHLYSIRCQAVATLGMIFKSMRKFNFQEWLHDSAPLLVSAFHHCDFTDDMYTSHGDDSASLIQNYAMMLNICLDAHENNSADRDLVMKEYCKDALRSTSASDHADEDYHGTELGGEWDPKAFVIRGAIILTLGALEEFERGVLRILFNHGEKSRATDSPKRIFTPRLSDYKQASLEWTRAEKSRKTHSVAERHSLLKQFSIIADPPAEWCRRLRTMRTDRNTIAHGIASLSHPFQVFLQLHYDVYRAVRHISTEAMAAQRIDL